MRGRSPGHCERLPVAIVQNDRKSEGRAVVSDFHPAFPVSEAELDAVEAFLGNAFRQIMESAAKPAKNQQDSAPFDSEAPQSPARLRRRTRVPEGT